MQAKLYVFGKQCIETSLLCSLSFFCSLSQKRNIGGTKKERRKQLRKRRACLAKSRDPPTDILDKIILTSVGERKPQ